MMEAIRKFYTFLLIIIASEKGGVRKTSIAIEFIDYLIGIGILPQIIQIDNQRRLEKFYPGRVTTIEMPLAAQTRENDLADAAALEILREKILDDETVVTIVDIGANFDGRFAESSVKMELNEDLEERNIDVVVIVPMTSENDAISLGTRTMERMEIAFPAARILPVLCRDGAGSLHLDDTTRGRYEKHVAPLVEKGEFLEHTRLLPGTLRILDYTGLTPSSFANLERRDIDKIFTAERGQARQARGDVAIHVEHFALQIDRLFSFRKDED